MKLGKILMDVLKLLRRNKRQSILTSVAIAISTFVVLIILSSSTYTTSSISDGLKLDENTTTLTFSPQDSLTLSGFTEKDKQLVEKELGKQVTLSSSSYGLVTSVSLGDSKKNLSFRTLADLEEHDLTSPAVLTGTPLEEIGDGLAISDKALMSLTRTTDVKNYIGSQVRIGGEDYRISSIFYASAVNEMLPAMLVSKENKTKFLKGKTYYDELVIPSNEMTDINKVLSALDKNGEFAIEGSYSYIDNQRVYEETEQQATSILNFIAFLSSISIFVAGFGVMNAMLSSVSERSKEIAIRRALGAKKADIHLSYLLEGTLLSTFGGVIGVGSALICLVLMNLSGLVAELSVVQIAITFLATIIFGVIFSIIPAMVASNKNVVEGLR